MDESTLGRRTYLKALLAAGTVTGLAGCSSSQDDSDTDTAPEVSNTTSNQDSSTTTQNQAPQILAHEATPQDNGTSLTVHLEGEDDNELSLARIEYGEQTIERTLDSASVTIDNELTEVGDVSVDESPGRATFLLRDSAGKETRTEALPDNIAPQLRTITVSPTENAGEISVTLHGKDNDGLKEVQLLVRGQPQLQENVSGQKEHSTDQNVEAPEDARFQQNTVTASLEDWNGNTTESETETYVRNYDVMEDMRSDIGAVYLPWMGGKFGNILSREEVEPRVGYYEDLINQQKEVVNQHVDQMQGHGINNVMFTIEGTQDHQKFRNLMQSSLPGEIGIEAFVALPQIFDRNEDLDSMLQFMKKEMMDAQNYNTVEGNPVVQFWNPSNLVYNIRDEIQEDYGGLTEFLGYVRESLTKDGVEPFLVGDANARGYSYGYGRAGFEEAEQFWRNWDGLTSWCGQTKAGETIPQDTAIEWVKNDYEGIRRFADENDQYFYPMVIPGFNDTHNEGWGQDRRIPRSVEAFQKRLKIAENYADGRINIYSFNEWAEGSQIEQGSFLGEEYGTDYLDVVAEFQQE